MLALMRDELIELRHDNAALLEALQEITESFDTMLLHFAKDMPREDRRTRTLTLQGSRAAIRQAS